MPPVLSDQYHNTSMNEWQLPFPGGFALRIGCAAPQRDYATFDRLAIQPIFLNGNNA
jgi:hypothetical protein